MCFEVVGIAATLDLDRRRERCQLCDFVSRECDGCGPEVLLEPVELGRAGDRHDPEELSLAQKPWIVPIPGTTKLHRLEENLGAAAVTLSADEIAQLTALSSAIEIEGGRYPDDLEAQTNL